jgi:nicotinamide-nucleotide amidase
MASRIALTELAKQALEVAKANNCSIVTAESCTAGKLSGLLSEAPGASALLHGGFVSYTKANKIKALGVSPDLLKEKGSVCVDVAIEMTKGAFGAFTGKRGGGDHWRRRARA